MVRKAAEKFEQWKAGEMAKWKEEAEEMARWEKEARGRRGLGSDVRIPTQQQRLVEEMERKQRNAWVWLRLWRRAKETETPRELG